MRCEKPGTHGWLAAAVSVRTGIRKELEDSDASVYSTAPLTFPEATREAPCTCLLPFPVGGSMQSRAGRKDAGLLSEMLSLKAAPGPWPHSLKPWFLAP